MDDSPAEALNEVESRLRTVLSLTDPAPAQLATLAKLAFEFRGTTLLEPLDAELAGARATLVDQGPMVFAGRTLRITQANGGIAGVIDGELAGVELGVQTASGVEQVQLDAFGAFRCVVPQRPFRLTLTVSGAQFATAWQ